MRIRVFRILAGLMAFLFVAFVDYSDRSPRDKLGFAFVTALFAIYAILGPQASDGWLQFWVPTARKREIEAGEQRREELQSTKDERQSPPSADQPGG